MMLDKEKDQEFIKLIDHIKDLEYGELKIKVKHSKPYLIIESEKSILLS